MTAQPTALLALLLSLLVGYSIAASAEAQLDGLHPEATCAENVVATAGDVDGPKAGAAMMQVRGYATPSDSKLMSDGSKEAPAHKVHSEQPGSCGPESDFSEPLLHTKCPNSSPPRLFDANDVELIQCYQMCRDTAGCTQFSYNGEENTDYYRKCMGCEEGSWEEHANFKGYIVCSSSGPPPTTTTTTTTLAPATTTTPTHCGPSDPPFYAVEQDSKCPYNSNLRLFTEASVTSAAKCYERCLATPNCGSFSWAAYGDYKEVCMGCVEKSGSERHETFTFYNMCQEATASTDPAICKLPSAEFKVCTAWGDPHFYSNFLSPTMNFDNHGIGAFMLAATTDATFEMQGFQCPFNDHAGSLAGVAWRIGYTTVTVIDDVVAVNGTNITHNGQLIDQAIDFPEGMDIIGSPSAGGVVFHSSDSCVRVRVQKRSVSAANTGYVLNEQVLIASGFVATEGMCGDVSHRYPVSPVKYLFNADQVSKMCMACGMMYCEGHAGYVPEFMPPPSYSPDSTPEAACTGTGTPIADANTACQPVKADDAHYQACRFDYCASGGDPEVAQNAIIALWEESAAVADVGLKPFSFETLPTDGEAGFFGENFKKLADHPGTCAQVYDVANDTTEKDCSPLGSYTCKSLTDVVLEINEDSEIKLGFRGEVKPPKTECGEGSDCPFWSDHKTCGGISARTRPDVVQGGTCVRGEIETLENPGQKGADWYEVGVGLYNENNEVVQSRLLRGKRLGKSFFQFEVNETENLYVMLFSASYDSDGDGDVGNTLKISNVNHGPCLTQTQLDLGPLQCIVDGSNANLTEDGYFLLAECCCDLEMEIYIRRVMEHEGLKECQKGTIWGMVPYYTCVHGSQSLEKLREDIWRHESRTNWTRAGFVTDGWDPTCQALALNCAEVDTSGCPSVNYIESENYRVPCGRFR